MTVATVISVTPYNDNFGSGVELCVSSPETGEYKAKRKSDHKDYSWISQLKAGEFVDLSPNTQGKGYYINKSKAQPQQSSGIDLNNKPVDPSGVFSGNKVNDMADLMKQCDEAIKARFKDSFYEPEQIKCLTVSLFIQASK